MYAAAGLTPEEVTEAYRRAATRPPNESGTPRTIEPADMTIPQLQAELVKAEYRISALNVDNTGLEYKLEVANKEIADLSARLQAASGTTTVSRERQTLKALQAADVIQRSDIWNLEAKVGAQRRTIESLQAEVKSLRKACAPSKAGGIDEHTVFEAEHKAAPRLRQIGDVLPGSAA